MKKMLVLLVTSLLLLSFSNVDAATVNKDAQSGCLMQHNEYLIKDIGQSASYIVTYVEKEHKIPTKVPITDYEHSTPVILHLMLKATDYINKGNKDPVEWDNYSEPKKSQENIKQGNISKQEYIELQNEIRKQMDKTSEVPCSINTSLGELGYKNIVYMYSKVLTYYNKNGELPESIQIEPWHSAEIDDIKVAASELDNYIRKNHKLPKDTKIDCLNISMPQFLYLSTTAVLQIKNNSTNAIIVKNFSEPKSPTDDIRPGIISDLEYLKIASDIKNYMDSSGKTPDFAYKTSLGEYMGFKNLIYMYSKILDYYNRNGKLPAYIEMASWS